MVGEIAGNAQVLQGLQESTKSGRLSHGYIIEGQDGIGKTTLSNYIAKLALCSGMQKPCGVCSHCKKLEKGIHPDLKIIAPKDGKASISVDQIKELRSDIYITPNEAEKKVYIIEEGQKMTLAAQNALLKSLEEPPTYVMIVICVPSKDMLLPVVLSRSVHLSLCPVTVKEAEMVLAARFPNKTASEVSLAAEVSRGLIGRGIEILKTPDFLNIVEGCVAFFKALSQKNRIGVQEFTGYLEKNKDNITQILMVLRMAIRDIMMEKSEEKIDLINKKQEITEICQELFMKSLVVMYEQIELCQKKLEANGNYNLTINVFVQNCWEEIR